MKTFLKVILVIVFVVLVPSFVSGLATRLSGLSGNFIKTKLVEQDAYTKLTELFFEYAKGDAALSGLTTFVRRELTAKYVQGKVEKLIDDTGNWASGTRKETPVISFVEVKDKLTKQNPQLITELRKLSEDLKKQQGQTSGFNVDEFIANDFTIRFQEKDLMWIKIWYWNAIFGVFLLPLLLGGILFGLYKLSDSPSSGFKWIGSTLIASSLWLLPSVGLVFLAFGLARGLIGESPDLPKDIWPMIESFANPFVSSYLKVGIVIVVLFFVVGIGCFIHASRLSPRERKT